MMQRKLKAFLVGVGPGAPRLVTPEAREIISRSEIILGWDMDLLPVRDCMAGKKVYRQDVNNYLQATRAAVREAKRSRKRLAVPRVGDPCLSSGLKGLMSALANFDVQIHPGISSVQLAAAHARINLDESSIISFHDLGDPEEKKRYLLDCFQKGRHLITLASPDLRPGPMSKWLIEQGVPPETDVMVGSSLSLPEQTITRTQLSGLIGRHFSWLSVTVVINPAAPSLDQDHRLWRHWRKVRTKEKRTQKKVKR
jgi:precorrin-6y C5,15-methyltransferase (decarboxylating) CbiE subunit